LQRQEFTIKIDHRSLSYLEDNTDIQSCKRKPSLFAHEMNKSRKLLLETWANWMVRFGKPDYPVLSGLTAVRGAAGLRRGSLSSGQVTSNW
jgi:hypothetical protein